MKKINHSEKARKLFWLWLISFFLAGNIAKIYVEEIAKTKYFTFHNAPDWYLWMVVALVTLYFCPLLLRIGYHAKLANMKKTLWFSRVMVFQHCLCLVLIIIEWISMLIG